jgi:Ca2+:H+ antiporter
MLCNIFPVALGSSVQIALFVLPVTVVVGWFTGKEMTMKFPMFEVALYILSVFIVAICLSNARSNWLEGALFVSLYTLIAVGIYFENDATNL